MDFATSLKIESWTLWTVGILVVTWRMISRLLVLRSWKKLQVDDYLMLFTVVGWVTYTGAVVSTNEVAINGSNYLPPGQADLLTPSQVDSAIYGSKMDVVLEEFTLFTTWQVKACVLIFYNRLTFGLGQNIAVKIVGAYCVLGFIVVQVLYLGVWCRPIYLYWTITDTESQCTSYINHMITATVFNVSSDLMILLIPVPLLLKLHLPLKRKIVLVCIFSLGIFVVLAAVLNRYYNFTEPYSLVFLNWYVGELSTAIYVSNIPLCWPLLRRLFRVNSFDNKYTGNTPNRYPSHGLSSHGSVHAMQDVLRQNSGRFRDPNEAFTFSSESEEHINGMKLWPLKKEPTNSDPTQGKTVYVSSVEAGVGEQG